MPVRVICGIWFILSGNRTVHFGFVIITKLSPIIDILKFKYAAVDPRLSIRLAILSCVDLVEQQDREVTLSKLRLVWSLLQVLLGRPASTVIALIAPGQVIS